METAKFNFKEYIKNSRNWEIYDDFGQVWCAGFIGENPSGFMSKFIIQVIEDINLINVSIIHNFIDWGDSTRGKLETIPKQEMGARAFENIIFYVSTSLTQRQPIQEGEVYNLIYPYRRRLTRLRKIEKQRLEADRLAEHFQTLNSTP